ncbi:hypothetical protein, partial [Anaerospora hongkongensis]|uniref:hypothetical protein n=1 Tax=Anaerospora hongkongensis TaxID=244830 RepID=UPI002FDAF22A
SAVTSFGDCRFFMECIRSSSAFLVRRFNGALGCSGDLVGAKKIRDRGKPGCVLAAWFYLFVVSGARSASLRAALQPLARLPLAVLGLLRSSAQRRLPLYARPSAACGVPLRCTLLIRFRPDTADA